MRVLTLTLIFGLLFGAGATLAAAVPAKAAPFKVQDLDGRAWTQQSKGLLLVDFWASWCVPCLKEIPALNSLQAKYRAAGRLTVLGLSLDKGGRAAVAAAAKKLGVAYAVAPVDPAVPEAYRVQGFPCAFLLRDGQVLLRLSGERNLAAFERDLAPYLR